MPIVMISSEAHGMGEGLARLLAEKTGFPLLLRDDMSEKARKQGIKLGRLETSIIKSPVVPERLARERDLYLAFVTSVICETAQDNNLIYHGRSGHLLLPGVTHRMRVGLVTPRETRISNVMNKLRLSQEKAETYLNQLDEDFDKWVRFIHKVDRSDPLQYDLFVNLNNISLSNLSIMLCNMAELPDFSPTPQSIKLQKDHHLIARAKILLASDERTRSLELGVRASDGIITVTYMPRQEHAVKDILNVLKDLEGCRETRCTKAETSILWIQEAFDPDSAVFNEVVQLSNRWGAAVELIRVSGKKPLQAEEKKEKSPEFKKTPTPNGGVEDDDDITEDDQGLTRTMDELVTIGRSAGGQTVYGSRNEIIERIKGNGSYALIVLGELFRDKDHEVRMRQTRELALVIRERLKTPVITTDELRSKFTFGKKQLFKLLSYAAVIVCIYSIVFTLQEPILNFLGGNIHENWKWLTSLGVALFVPVIAYFYSNVTSLILKLIGID